MQSWAVMLTVLVAATPTSPLGLAPATPTNVAINSAPINIGLHQLLILFTVPSFH